jgi:hypothetical protein
MGRRTVNYLPYCAAPAYGPQPRGESWHEADFITLLGGAAAVWPLAALQQPDKLPTLGDAKMSDANRLLFLRIALIVIGLTFIFGIYTLGVVWPSGWAWGQGHSHYLMMIIGVYATLGVFLLIASRNPYAHKSLIWFTVWSSVVHAAIMGVQALTDPAERGHLVGDVPALILVAIILAVLMPRGLHKLESGRHTVPA